MFKIVDQNSAEWIRFNITDEWPIRFLTPNGDTVLRMNDGATEFLVGGEVKLRLDKNGIFFSSQK